MFLLGKKKKDKEKDKEVEEGDPSSSSSASATNNNNNNNNNNNKNNNPADAKNNKDVKDGASKDDKQGDSTNQQDDGSQYAVKAGTYMVSVHIIEARGIKSRDASGTSDPVIEMTVLNIKKNTETRKKCLSAFWDSLHYFEFANLEISDVECGVINISLYDANTLSRNVLIGSYEFGLGYVYQQKNHELFRTWVPMTDTTDKYEGTQGYVRLSVSVVGPGDDPATHTDEEIAAADDAQTVMAAPNIKQEGHLFSIECHRAMNLPDTNTIGGSIDSYVQAKFCGNIVKCHHKDKNNNPVWGERLDIQVMLPVMSDNIELSIYDHEKLSSDRLVATSFIKYSDFKKNGGVADAPKNLRWINFYGPMPDQSNDASKKMAAGRMEGSNWLGRALFSFYDIQKQNPDNAVVKLDKTSDGVSSIPSREYTLWIDIFDGAELPVENGDVKIKINWGNQTLKPSEKAESKNGMAKFYYSFPEIKQTFPEDVSQLPDVFFYLEKYNAIAGKTRLAYFRLSCQHLVSDQNNKGFPNNPSWYLFKEDKTIDAIPNGIFPGQLMARVSLAATSVMSRVNRLQIFKPKYEKYLLRANIYMGRDLAAMDEDGASDPYCIIKISGQKMQSGIKFRTLYPNWFTSLESVVELPEPLSLSQDVHVLCYDHDDVGGDDPMGRFSVSMSDIDMNLPEKPRWYNLHLDDVNVPIGSILASFQLLPQKFLPIPPLSIRPKTYKCVLEVTIVGLRNLDPFELLPIQNAFIEFSLGDGIRIDTKKSNRPSGDNPNYLVVETKAIEIPVEQLYCPTLNVRVKDDRKLRKPIIGSSSFSLAKYVPWYPIFEDQRKREEQEEEEEEEEDKDYDPNDPAQQRLKMREAQAGSDVLAASSVPQATGASGGGVGANAAGVGVGVVPTAAAGIRKDVEMKGLDATPLLSPSTAVGATGANAAGVGGNTSNASSSGSSSSSRSSVSSDDDKKNASQTASKPTVAAPPPRQKSWWRNTFKIPAISAIQSGDTPLIPANIEIDTTPPYLLGRRIFDKELESTFKSLPFHEFHINRGMLVNVDVLFGTGILGGIANIGSKIKEAGQAIGAAIGIEKQEDGLQSVGKFKGFFRVIPEGKSGSKPPFDLAKLQTPQIYVVRVYLLRGINLMAKNSNGLSDPYVKIKLANTKLDNRDKHEEKTVQPEFYHMFEFRAQLPGASQLEIECWDYNQLLVDEKIGSTTIDLENLVFSKKWKSYALKPVERRTLKSSTSNAPQGKLEMWLDIIPLSDIGRYPPINIAPPPKLEFELRVVIFQARQMVNKDSWTDQNDLYITATLEGSSGFTKKYETDVHLRAKEGKGSFNYRFVYDIELPMKNPRLKIQAWDFDIFSSNDVIGETVVSLDKLFKIAYKMDTDPQKSDIPKNADGKPQKMESLGFVSGRKEEPEKFWLELYHPDDDSGKGQGQVQMSVEIIPKHLAALKPAGRARKEPNMNPVLDAPERIKFNLFRPDLMLRELLGNELYGKLLFPLKVIYCVFICVGILWVVAQFTPVLQLLGLKQ